MSTPAWVTRYLDDATAQDRVPLVAAAQEPARAAQPVQAPIALISFREQFTICAVAMVAIFAGSLAVRWLSDALWSLLCGC